MSTKHKLIIGISIYKLDELSYILSNVDYFSNLDTVCSIHVICNPAIILDAQEILDVENVHNINLEKGIPDFFTPYDEGSYRHAGNLNILARKYSNSEQIILCDPDIIFVKQSFFTDLKKSHDDGAAIIGLEWDLTIPSKWRDFPAPHFISIDPQKINIDLIDFRPYLESSFKKRERNKKFKKVVARVNQTKIRLIPGLMNFLLLYFKKNLSSDTGYFFREFILRRKYSVKLIGNSVNYYNFRAILNILKNISRVVRKLPARLGLVPKVSHYTSCLIDDYFYLYKATRPEEMVFNDEVCAIHFRSVRVANQQNKSALQLNLEFLDKVDVSTLVTSHYVRNPKFMKVESVSKCL